MAKKPLQSTEAGDLEDLIGYNLKRAYVIVQDDFRQALGDDNMSPRVFTALSLTVNHPNITQSALARMMGVERSGLVAIVDALEDEGYLRRAPVPGDRRVHALVPTKAGTSAYEKTLGLVKGHEARLFSCMTANEKQTLLDLLKKVRRQEERA